MSENILQTITPLLHFIGRGILAWRPNGNESRTNEISARGGQSPGAHARCGAAARAADRPPTPPRIRNPTTPPPRCKFSKAPLRGLLDHPATCTPAVRAMPPLTLAGQRYAPRATEYCIDPTTTAPPPCIAWSLSLYECTRHIKGQDVGIACSSPQGHPHASSSQRCLTAARLARSGPPHHPAWSLSIPVLASLVLQYPPTPLTRNTLPRQFPQFP